MKIPYIEKIERFFVKKYESISLEELANLEKLEIPVAKIINSFSIIPRVYESELNNKYGIILSAIKNGKKSRFQGDLEENVSFSGGYNQSVEQIDDKILKKYKSIPGFCSMVIKNRGQLMEHVKKIHELSYNHYVFGKENKAMEDFPNFYCGMSTRNIFLSLMEKGYPNASFFYNNKRDHAYAGLPFLFEKNQKKGFIIIDPTSDQLFNDRKNAPRNNLFVAFGTKWEYKTDWKGGADLFPDSNDKSIFSNLDTLRSRPHSFIYASKNIDDYFERVFRNPVEVSVDSFDSIS
ncbi:hypothetical protein KAT36_02090 [Candidatus Pacearchaeota archaeon]|nr:hypothetical protein [Candidatus Pacearchaeota archaeon]